MGAAGSSSGKKRVLTKLQVVSALSAKSSTSLDEEHELSRSAEHHVKKTSIRGINHRLLYNDTSNAWKELRKNLPPEVFSSKSNGSSSDHSSVTLSIPSETEVGLGAINDVHIYGSKRKISRDENCSVCGTTGSYNGIWHGCRICDKLYHQLCLEQKGGISDELNSKALAESETSVGWSCPDCENIFDLLTESEKRKIIESFDNMVGNDTSVVFEKYIRRKKLSYANLVGSEMPMPREVQEVSLFKDLDRDGSGSLEWWEFAPAMALRFLSRRKPSQLIALLTPREVSKLESFFREYDKDGKGRLTISQAKCAYLKWFLSLIKRDDENNIPLPWTGELPSGWFGEVKSDYVGVQAEAEITWQKFLSMNALHVLSARPNTVETRPYAPPVNEAIRLGTSDKDKAIVVDLSAMPALDENDVSEFIDPVERINMRLRKRATFS